MHVLSFNLLTVSSSASIVLNNRHHFHHHIPSSRFLVRRRYSSFPSVLASSTHTFAIGNRSKSCSSKRYYSQDAKHLEGSISTSSTMSSSLNTNHKKKKGKKISKSKLKKLSKEENAREASWNLFTNFYSPFYGKDRWDTLVEELKKPIRYCALLNRYYDAAAQDPTFLQNLLGVGSRSNNVEKTTTTNELTLPLVPPSIYSDQIPGIIIRTNHHNMDETNISSGDTTNNNNNNTNDNDNNLLWPAPSSHPDPNGLYPYYPMDAASLIPVLCLNLHDGPTNMQIFDMCSAPGGKALGICMLWNIKENGGRLYCADVSSDRRARLKRTITNYIPSDIRENHISVITGDGTSNTFLNEFGYNKFDRILVDAPCSSERHLLFNDSEMLKWGVGRSKANAKRQVALLFNALRLTKPGGRIVYSTCSLSPYENDDVIEKVIQKARKKATLLFSSRSSSSSSGETTTTTTTKYVRVAPLHLVDIRIGGDKTKYGYHLLPDVSDSWGPIYVCALDVLEGVPPDLEEVIDDEEDSNDSDDNSSSFSDDPT